MAHKVYVGFRPGGPDSPDVSVSVVEDGTPRPLPSRQDLRQYSPEGFGWGYGGALAAQLALAILADLTGDARYALKHHHWFKLEVISHLPSHQWKLTEGDVRDWTEQHHPLDAQR